MYINVYMCVSACTRGLIPFLNDRCLVGKVLNTTRNIGKRLNTDKKKLRNTTYMNSIVLLSTYTECIHG